MFISQYFRYLVLLTLVLFAKNGFSQERPIKPGDAIEIEVFGQPDMSRILVVRTNGTVNYPFLEGIPVDGLTLQRFQDILVGQLSRYMERTPLVTVRFTGAYPITVKVSGQVAMPGIYQMDKTSSFQGAFFAAGGLTPGARLSKIKLIRVQGGKRINDEVNLEKFYMEGDVTYLPELKDGDTIVVPGNPLATTVKVLGGVVSPGSYEVTFGASVLDVIFMAGGPSEDANLSKIKVISLIGQNVQEVRVNIRDLSKSQTLKAIPIVVPGDVVYVPQKGLTWGKFMKVMRDITTFATLGFLIVQINRQ